jgi:hypothetical protein
MGSDPLCAYCAKPGKLHRDHVVPRSRGGPDNAMNIVMACPSCNSSKGDRLASEWMGERCPAAVLLIETRVNAKLKAIYKPRDKGKSGVEERPPEPSRLYAFTTSAAGAVEYIGEVLAESEKTVRLDTVNCLSLMAGIWEPSEVRDVPRDRCRLFSDRDTMLDVLDAKDRDRRR